MGRDFVTPPAVVDLHSAGGVNGETLVGVDSHAEETRVGLMLDSMALRMSVKREKHVSLSTPDEAESNGTSGKEIQSGWDHTGRSFIYLIPYSSME